MEPPEGFTLSRFYGRVQGRAKVCTLFGEMLSRSYYLEYDNESSVWNNPVLEREESAKDELSKKRQEEKYWKRKAS